MAAKSFAATARIGQARTTTSPRAIVRIVSPLADSKLLARSNNFLSEVIRNLDLNRVFTRFEFLQWKAFFQRHLGSSTRQFVCLFNASLDFLAIPADQSFDRGRRLMGGF